MSPPEPMMRSTAAVVVLHLVLAGCGSSRPAVEREATLVDPNATLETRALFVNLRELSRDHLLFGHQDDLAYGVTWKREPGRSDVHDVTGAYPAVYGWELGHLENGAEENLDGVNFEDMKGWIREGRRRGGVITISWHMNNPASGGSAWDTTRAVHTILPGGEHHETYRQWLDRFAAFASDLEVGPLMRLGFGRPVPIIFRPFHEHTGSWFWWGGEHVTPDEYKRLWRFTVEYLRDEKDLHNLLYGYSPDVFDTEEQYFRYYPGDEYVDVLGLDDYHSLGGDETTGKLTERLRMLVGFAEERGKIAAFTETGSSGIPYDRWWTDRLLAAIKSDPVARRVAWVLVWRNANEDDFADHYFAPYRGHASAPDFVEFYNDPFVLFEDGLPNLYR